MTYDKDTACPHGKLYPCCKECWPKEECDHKWNEKLTPQHCEKCGINIFNTPSTYNASFFEQSKKEKCNCGGSASTYVHAKSCGVSKEEKNEDIQCPVCGYYCLGKGGSGCIDKPSLVGSKENECGNCKQPYQGGSLCPHKKEKCICGQSLKNHPEYCFLASSPTWEAQEREAWKETSKYFDIASSVRPLIADYWLERMKEVREEAYNQGKKEGIDWAHVQDSKQIPFFKEQGRSQALEEAGEIMCKIYNYPCHCINENKTCYHTWSPAFHKLLSSLQQLKDKK